MLTFFQLAFYRCQFAWTIRRFGFGIMYVGDYHTAPTWAYTVGFQERLAQPEVIVFDVPRASAHGVLWRIFVELKLGDLQLKDGAEWTEGTEGGAMVWRRVHDDNLTWERGWLGMASRRRWKRTGSPDGLEAFQLVLSDPNGYLPWEEGYDPRLTPFQPELWLPGKVVDARLAEQAAV